MSALPFLPVLLWSDVLVWLMAIAALLLGIASTRQPQLAAAWRRVGRSRPGMASATLVLVFVVVGLLDSLHYRPLLPAAPDAPAAPAAYAVETLSLLDSIAEPLRTRNEKTYSAPLATRAFAKETREERAADGSVRQVRDFPRLRYGGAHLGDADGTSDASSASAGPAADDGTQTATARPRLSEADRDIDITRRAGSALAAALALWALLLLAATSLLARREAVPLAEASRRLWRGETVFAWKAVLLTLAAVFIVAAPLLALCADYHVFGTDKVGQDVFYQVLKSVRTALVIGLVTTLTTLPLAIFFGLAAGYFRGWVDDLIQYLYTTLNSIPGVLLIAAAVLMMQVLIDTHPQWFSTAAERADMRLLALCFILGMTSWTGLCRVLRGETLKLRELEFVQAAQSFGVADLRIIARHILPNVMHIVVIALVMDFSSLVLAEAVLSYVGIGVDPTMISFGTMINNARLELAREPMVWWSLAAAFTFMFALVLAANLLADAVRDAFDARLAGSS
ncbi:ABC transporter permease [Rhodocyclus tenuis]|uniref:Peptide/nickel transport system permease protein n=1 Tax=Rhodocyclus tenuis TaxID=1066 RepID=A0A840G9F9_RHOTE|nr:ABC transporter permease [Rhodocyclus tenuis]MBB4247530.1 peptide/nickel transport system permease protein [Rhodocyclus tenuis]